MPRSNKVNVIKVPLKVPTQVKTADFPRMPRMYLELLENKDKIKPSMVNREYDPDELSTTTIPPETPSVGTFEKREGDNDEFMEKSSISSLSAAEEEEEEEDPFEENMSEEAEEKKREEERSFQETSSHSSFGSYHKKGSHDSLSSPQRSPVSVSSNRRVPDSSFYPKETTKEQLHQILNPPKLSDLERLGEVHPNKVIPNIGMYGTETFEQEDELKRELLYKYEILKRSNRTLDIPDFTMHSDYKTMNRTYENALRRISLNSNVENYKNYMIVAFMLMEYILGTWFKFDMAGYTQQQILNLNQYERLLIELGEKSYVPPERQWPVELRLLGLVLLNTVIFLIAKIMIKKTGTNLLGLLQTTITPPPTSSQAKPKRKMKGPQMDLHSIPDILEDDISVK